MYVLDSSCRKSLLFIVSLNIQSKTSMRSLFSLTREPVGYIRPVLKNHRPVLEFLEKPKPCSGMFDENGNLKGRHFLNYFYIEVHSQFPTTDCTV